MRLGLAVLTTLALLAGIGTRALLAAPAAPGVATVEAKLEGRGDERVEFVRYVASDGQANRITATLTRGPGGPGTATITDRAGAAAGRGCVSVDSTTVTCSLGNAAADAFAFDLGDRDDDARIVASPTSGVFDGGSGDDRLDAGRGSWRDPAYESSVANRASFRGGPGDDVMIGGPGDDTFDEEGPGPNGADTLRGAGGADSVSYARRRAGVRASLAGDRDDGAAGERDEIVGIENVMGSHRPDRLLGDGADNELIGGAGPDVLAGGGGDDALHADDYESFKPSSRRTADRLLGGAGDDALVGTAGVNAIDAGPGEDSVRAGAGADRVTLRDRSIDAVDCDRGADVVEADGLDFVPRGCRRLARSGAPRAVVVSVSGALGSVDRPYLTTLVGCPVDFDEPRCRVRVTASRRGAVVGSASWRVRRGEPREDALYLNRAGTRFLRRLGRRPGRVRIDATTRAGLRTRRASTKATLYPIVEP